mmetsp:Transcript_32442/g.84237  ORF Transcript_32442/g.84237 Transcript_32442/m.84237 type:complete len:205 (-) Transcript_32442:130-744(-)
MKSFLQHADQLTGKQTTWGSMQGLKLQRQLLRTTSRQEESPNSGEQRATVGASSSPRSPRQLPEPADGHPARVLLVPRRPPRLAPQGVPAPGFLKQLAHGVVVPGHLNDGVTAWRVDDGRELHPRRQRSKIPLQIRRRYHKIRVLLGGKIRRYQCSFPQAILGRIEVGDENPVASEIEDDAVARADVFRQPAQPRLDVPPRGGC